MGGPIDRRKLTNFLLSIQFIHEKLTDLKDKKIFNEGVLSTLDDIYAEMESGRIDFTDEE